jgi:hypothetical protein
MGEGVMSDKKFDILMLLAIVVSLGLGLSSYWIIAPSL